MRLLEAEVPVHYLLNLTRDRMAAAVELGVQAGRAWCREHGIALTTPNPTTETTTPNPTTGPTSSTAPTGSVASPSVRFTERMTGHAGFGHEDPRDDERDGRRRAIRLAFELTIVIHDLDRFVIDPQRLARAHGHVVAEALGGRLEIAQGWFNLFVNQQDPNDKRMLYHLWFHDAAGHPLTLQGQKVIRDDPGRRAWADTTTLFVSVRQGHLAIGVVDTPVVMAGVLRIRPRDFARQLTTFRASAPTPAARAAAVARFRRMFLGHLWDVYGNRRFAARGRGTTLARR